MITRFTNLTVGGETFDEMVECRLKRSDGCLQAKYADETSENGRPLIYAFYWYSQEPALLPKPVCQVCRDVLIRSLGPNETARFEDAFAFLKGLWLLQNVKSSSFKLSEDGIYVCAAETPFGHVVDSCPKRGAEAQTYKNMNLKVRTPRNQWVRGREEPLFQVWTADSGLQSAPNLVVGTPDHYALKAAASSFKRVGGRRGEDGQVTDLRITGGRNLEFAVLGEYVRPIRQRLAQEQQAAENRRLVDGLFDDEEIEALPDQPAPPPAAEPKVPTTRRRVKTEPVEAEVQGSDDESSEEKPVASGRRRSK